MNEKYRRHPSVSGVIQRLRFLCRQ